MNEEELLQKLKILKNRLPEYYRHLIGLVLAMLKSSPAK